MSAPGDAGDPSASPWAPPAAGWVPPTLGWQQPPPFPGPQQRPGAGTAALLPVGRTPLSIIAGYLGLFCVLVVPAPVCLLVSVLALVQLRNRPHKLGRGRAWFGLVMSVLALGSVLVVVVSS